MLLQQSMSNLYKPISLLFMYVIVRILRPASILSSSWQMYLELDSMTRLSTRNYLYKTKLTTIAKIGEYKQFLHEQ